MPASRWASQAALDTMLRFNPQRQALMEQIAEAKGTYGAAVKAGNVAAGQTEVSVKRALPVLQQAYAQASAAEKPGVSLVSQQLAQLPADTQQYRANQAAAGQNFLANLAAARAEALSTMQARIPRAREGAQFNQLDAHRALVAQLSQIFAKQQALQSEAGAFAQQEAEKLEGEAEGRRVTERGQNITHADAVEGHRVSERGQNLTRTSSIEGHGVTERGQNMTKQEKEEELQQKLWEHNHPAKKGGSNETWPGIKEATPDEHNKAKEDIENIRHEAYHLRTAQHLNYNQVNQIMQQPVKTKEYTRKAYPNSGKLRAGLDLAYFGGVGTGAMGELHKEGYSLAHFGYPVYRPPTPAQSWEGLNRQVQGIPRL